MPVSNVQRAQTDQPSALTPAAKMLSELQAAHVKLLAYISEMDRLCQPPAKCAQELTAARFRLSHASLSRRVLVEQVCGYLGPLVNDTDAQALRSLAKERFDYIVRSTAHISRWPIEKVAQDWSGYCVASRAIRREMARTVETEKSALYAMLQRYRNG
jgi:hypothetical protein